MRTFLALAVLLLAIAFAGIAVADARSGYLVVVNPSNPAQVLERKFTEDAFLKKVSRWPSDEVIQPVDLAPSSPTRRRFTEDVLNRTVEAVKGYWQQRIFAGRDVPPPELETDDDVVKFVLKHPGGIGYVSPGASLGGTKVVEVR